MIGVAKMKRFYFQFLCIRIHITHHPMQLQHEVSGVVVVGYVPCRLRRACCVWRLGSAMNVQECNMLFSNAHHFVCPETVFLDTRTETSSFEAKARVRMRG